MYMTQGKRSPTMYCAVYTRFARSEQTRKSLKRGEGLQIASEAGRFGEGSVHNGYVTETNAGEGARCALIRVSPQ